VKIDNLSADQGESFACNSMRSYQAEKETDSIRLDKIQFESGSNLGQQYSAEVRDCDDQDSTAVIVVGIIIGVLIVAAVGAIIYGSYRDRKIVVKK